MNATTKFDLTWPWSLGCPEATALIRAEYEDFFVSEQLSLPEGGAGEHVWLQIEKRATNTEWLAQQLAIFANVAPIDVSYSGRKDRYAITRQWFCVRLAGKPEPHWPDFNSECWRVLSTIQQPRKLRMGEHTGNAFVLRLREWQGDPQVLVQRLTTLAERGVPNYFGNQRFGRDAGNLLSFQEYMLPRRPIRNRNQKAMVLSAARSWLFNHVLAARVRANNWQAPIDGETDMATAPLWGRGRSSVGGLALAIEQEALAPWAEWCDRLEHSGLNQERRALCLKPIGLTWQLERDDVVCLSFSLPTGSFATSLLRELAHCREPTLNAR